MSEKILEAFKKLKSQLDVRDYDDERFIKDLPENEPVSLVIPFERTGRGYLDIFRSYIGGDEHPELSDEELLEHYLQTPEGKEDPNFGDEKNIPLIYNPTFFRAFIEEDESGDHVGRVGKHRNRFSKEEVTKLIQTLKKQGINAVSKQDEKSQEPSTVVVMDNGIMTPFMDKKTVDLLMPRIKKAMSSCGFAVGGHIAPVTFEQLRSPFGIESTSEKRDFAYNFIHEFSKQPSTQLSEIKNLDQLITTNEKIKFSRPIELSFIDEENDKTGRPYVWRGGVLGDHPFIANIDTESREAHVLRKSWAMATPDMGYALRYAKRDENANFGKEGFGFLYQYNTSGQEAYFPDRGIERTPSTAVIPGPEEVPLLPHINTLKNIFFYYQPDFGKNERYLMRLDPNNPEHQKLLKLYEAKDTQITGNLKQRRINQFNEASANNGHPNSYTPTIQEPDVHHSEKLRTRLSKYAEDDKDMVQEDNSKTTLSLGQQEVLNARKPQH